MLSTMHQVPSSKQNVVSSTLTQPLTSVESNINAPPSAAPYPYFETQQGSNQTNTNNNICVGNMQMPPYNQQTPNVNQQLLNHERGNNSTSSIMSPMTQSTLNQVGLTPPTPFLISSPNMSSMPQPGQPPNMSSMSQPGQPHNMLSMSQLGQPPNMSSMPQSGQSPNMNSMMSQPGQPPNMSSMPQSGQPHNMNSMMSQPGQPPNMSSMPQSGQPHNMNSMMSQPGQPPNMSSMPQSGQPHNMNSMMSQPGQPQNMLSMSQPSQPPNMSSMSQSGQPPNMNSMMSQPGQPPNMSSMPQPGQPPNMNSMMPPGQPPNINSMMTPNRNHSIPPMPSMMQSSQRSVMPSMSQPGQPPNMSSVMPPNQNHGISSMTSPGVPPMPSMMPFNQGSNVSPLPPSGLPPIPSNMPPNQMMQNQYSDQNSFPSMQGMMNGLPPMMPPAGAGGMQKQRLNLNMMPSVVQVIEDDRVSRSGQFPTGYPVADLPPLVTTQFIAQDQGNCNPKFIRSTVYAFPQSQDMVKNSTLPISLSITPLAALNDQEVVPPIIDLGEMGPVRCQRCKAYMCPFMEFIDGGRKFKCPFCKASTPVEDSYFAHLDHTGKRTDISYRPELYFGSYEFIATKAYCKNELKPKEPAFIFMLDVSYNAVRNGLVELFCRNISKLLKNLPIDVGKDKSVIKIGLATYDNVLHFYKLKNNGKPEMLILHDINDVFAPVADSFLVDFDQAEESLNSCLKEIALNFLDTRVTETLLGPVIQAGIDALKTTDRCGKIFVFHTSLPSLECPGQLKNREDRKLLGTDKEKAMLSPANDFYTKLGEQCVSNSCSVDLFLFPNSYVDLASIAPISTISGGQIYKYQYFDVASDGVRFLNDLKHNINRYIVFDAMMRVRTSTGEIVNFNVIGIRPTGFYGSFYMQNTTDIELGTIDSDKSVQVEIKYDDKLDEKEFVYIQAALLFTSCSGERRLRIHNLSLQVTNDYNQIYRFTDEDAMITHLFKHAERIVQEKSSKEMRDEMTLTCARILSTYRDKCNETAPMGQLILPECLKLLPIYTNCVIKNDALTGGSELTVDDRAWMMSLVPSMKVEDVLRFLYPRIYKLVQSPNTNSGETQSYSSNLIRASIDYFQHDEAYLIENGFIAFIWVGLNVSPQWIQNVFNVNSIQQLDCEKHELPSFDNADSQAVCQLWENLNTGRNQQLKLFITKEQGGLESWMKKFLVEDRYAANSMSYVEFLCEVHREIRNILS